MGLSDRPLAVLGPGGSVPSRQPTGELWLFQLILTSPRSGVPPVSSSPVPGFCRFPAQKVVENSLYVFSSRNAQSVTGTLHRCHSQIQGKTLQTSQRKAKQFLIKNKTPMCCLTGYTDTFICTGTTRRREIPIPRPAPQPCKHQQPLNPPRE